MEMWCIFSSGFTFVYFSFVIMLDMVEICRLPSAMNLRLNYLSLTLIQIDLLRVVPKLGRFSQLFYKTSLYLYRYFGRFNSKVDFDLFFDIDQS